MMQGREFVTPENILPLAVIGSSLAVAGLMLTVKLVGAGFRAYDRHHYSDPTDITTYPQEHQAEQAPLSTPEEM